eukprot:TRINITY_DN4666_c0_g1_i1.p1 TRINITY_DN4666_c0_g1~~TRINITY_DN4666_c0_g1_i1.p1  ORF type:complete len:285 (-),score=91.87 TRINITY_DN4666_c0_g1_i1:77-931(-)
MSKENFESNQLFDVKGKVCLVTGGASGIGKMFASAYVQNGATVYIASRKLKPLEEAAKEMNQKGPGKAIPIVADVSTKEGCDSLAQEIKNREKKLDVLVNNSGMSWGAPLEKFPEKEGWDNLMALNVKSIYYLTVALIPLLELNANNVEPGRVIVVSSVAGITPISEGKLSPPGSGTWSYNASKAAASHLARSLASTLAHRFITVNTVAPGVFPSRMTAYALSKAEEVLKSSQPTGRLGTGEDIAGIALFLASRASSHITGAVIPVDGGINIGGFGDNKPKSKL